MQAILAREFGGPEVLKLEDVPDPSPGRARSACASTRSASIRTTPTCGRRVRDQAGPAVHAGRRCRRRDRSGRRRRAPVKAGDRVYVSGTASARRTAPTRNMRSARRSRSPAPRSISFTQGAGLFVPYVTAWRALFGRANTRAGDTVLIHGASGGVGVAATQFAVAAGADGDRHRGHGRKASPSSRRRARSTRSITDGRLPRSDHDARGRTRPGRHSRDARERQPGSRPDRRRAGRTQSW